MELPPLPCPLAPPPAPGALAHAPSPPPLGGRPGPACPAASPRGGAAAAGAAAVLAVVGWAARPSRRRGWRSQTRRFRVCCAASGLLDDLVDELVEEGGEGDFSDADLIEEDGEVAAASAARSEQEIQRLFLEGCAADESLSFEALARVSEIAGMIGEGDLSTDELRQMWAEVPKRGDAIDIAGFRLLLSRIDDLFEPVDEEATTRYMVQPGLAMSDLLRNAVRKTIRKGEWKLYLEPFSEAPQVRPPLMLPGGLENPLCDLGECGGNICCLNRLRPEFKGVRPEFQDFCVQNILERLDTSAGIIYTSVSCGYLYFDWELLDRLVNVEGVSVAEVWLVEPLGLESGKHLKAQAAFTSWFADAGITVRAFQSLDILSDWVRVLPSGDQAHLVVQCDPEDDDAPVPQQAIIRPGGLHVTLTQVSALPLDDVEDFGIRKPMRKLYQRGLEGQEDLRITQCREEDGSWVKCRDKREEKQLL